MSLELALEKNTAAINALVEILSKGIVPAAAQPEGLTLEQTFEEPAPKVKKTKKEEPAAEPATPKVVTYAEAAAAVTRLVKENGREAAKALLAEFGAANLKEIPEARFAEVIAAAKKAAA